MKTIKKFRGLVAALSLGALLVPSLFALTTQPAMAHETPCPYCGLKVVQDTKEQDNEVVLRYGNKRIEYRCVLCAFADAKKKYKNDVTILAPSTVKGKPATIVRKDGKWSITPATAGFVYAEGSHKQCQDRYRAVLDHPGYDAYVKAKGATLKDAKHLSLTEMIEHSK